MFLTENHKIIVCIIRFPSIFNNLLEISNCLFSVFSNTCILCKIDVHLRQPLQNHHLIFQREGGFCLLQQLLLLFPVILFLIQFTHHQICPCLQACIFSDLDTFLEGSQRLFWFLQKFFDLSLRIVQCIFVDSLLHRFFQNFLCRFRVSGICQCDRIILIIHFCTLTGLFKQFIRLYRIFIFFHLKLTVCLQIVDIRHALRILLYLLILKNIIINKCDTLLICFLFIQCTGILIIALQRRRS